MPIAPSIRERILVQLVAGMNAGAQKPATTYRTRADALAAGELPAYILYAVQSDPDRKGPGITYHDLTVRVEGLVAGEAPQDAALDPLLVYAVQTFFAVCESLGSIKGLEERQTTWLVEAALKDMALAAVDFSLTFATAASDPAVEK